MTSSKKARGKGAIDQILADAAVFTHDELTCYNENRFNSLNEIIDQLEEISLDPETPEEIISEVNECLIEMLNVRMKLLNLNGGKSNISPDVQPSVAASVDDNHSQSSQNVPILPPIDEPDIPDPRLLNFVPDQINHPDSFFISLFQTSDAVNTTYTQTITVRAHNPANLATSAFGRAFINYVTACNHSFVSPRLLRKLNIKPIKITPRPVTTLLGPGRRPVDSYVILELSSLYKPEFTLKSVFYVYDVNFYRITPFSENLIQAAADKGLVLSNELWPNGDDKLDILFGPVHSKLIGFSGFDEQLRFNLVTQDESLDIYYTHFGYCPYGFKNKIRNNIREDFMPVKMHILSQDNPRYNNSARR